MINTSIARLQYDNVQPNKTIQNVQQNKQDNQLRKACEDFEAIFVKQMLKSMKSTITKSGLLDGGFAEEIYDDMLYDEYAKKMTKTANFGIANSLYRQLSNDV
jgi:peptidoglycan hydrolase FlgJ